LLHTICICDATFHTFSNYESLQTIRGITVTVTVENA